MDTVLGKWGNSLAVRIPASIAKNAGVRLGVPLHVSARHGRIVLEPVTYDLKSLLQGVTPENTHAEEPMGLSCGHERW